MNLRFWRKQPEQKATIDISKHEPWFSWWGAASGEHVSPETALGVSTVAACVRVVAQDVGKMPLAIMQEGTDGVAQTRRAHPLNTILNRQPNEFMTAQEFRETLTAHAMLTGDGFALPLKTGNGKVTQLIPLLPQWVEVLGGDFPNGNSYRVRIEGRVLGEFAATEVLHIKNTSWDAIQGMSAVDCFRDVIGLGIAMEKSQAGLHRNAGRPSGILTTPNKLNRETAENLKTAWQEAHAGSSNAFKTAVLDQGIEFKPVTMSGSDAQTLQSRQFQVEEICRAFGVFPQMVGHSQNTPYNSAEAFFSAHFRQTVWPWLVRWEQSIDRDLLDKSGPLFARFDTRGFEKASTADRAQYYRSMVELGIYTRNEIRELEGLPPLAGLDEPLTPLNMGPGNGT